MQMSSENHFLIMNAYLMMMKRRRLRKMIKKNKKKWTTIKDINRLKNRIRQFKMNLYKISISK